MVTRIDAALFETAFPIMVHELAPADGDAPLDGFEQSGARDRFLRRR